MDGIRIRAALIVWIICGVVCVIHASRFGASRGSMNGHSRMTQSKGLWSRLSMQMVVEPPSTMSAQGTFLQEKALCKPPTELNTLLALLEFKGEVIVDPFNRGGLNPFVVPISKIPGDDSMLAYVRWPTQRDDMDLHIVRTNDDGIELIAKSTVDLCKRIVAEMDFFSDPNAAKAIEVLNAGREKPLYEAGAFLPILRSGKFPTLTREDLQLVLDRFLLTSVGPFPDCYQRLADRFFEKKDVVSALVTCERAVDVFYGYGHPVAFQARMLLSADRDAEAKDAARSAMGMPKWTLRAASDPDDVVDQIARLAGFTSKEIVGEMHAFRAKDAREDDIGEGMDPKQVTLDQAGHLMDAVALGAQPGGWAGNAEAIAEKYDEGGYPEMASFIREFI